MGNFYKNGFLSDIRYKGSFEYYIAYSTHIDRFNMLLLMEISRNQF